MENETVVEGEAPKEQQSKSTVEYGPGIEGEDCLACKNFKEPDRCRLVRGEISPSGTCNLWELPEEVAGFSFGDSESIEDILFGPEDA